MKLRPINAADAPPAPGGYAQAMEVSGASRSLYVSGQIPVDGRRQRARKFRGRRRGSPGPTCLPSCAPADMTLDNLVKVTIFLSDRKYIADYRHVRNEMLGGRHDRADHHHHGHLRREMAAGDRGCRRRLNRSLKTLNRH